MGLTAVSLFLITLLPFGALSGNFLTHRFNLVRRHMTTWLAVTFPLSCHPLLQSEFSVQPLGPGSCSVAVTRPHLLSGSGGSGGPRQQRPLALVGHRGGARRYAAYIFFF